MSEAATTGREGSRGVFRPRTVALMLAVGVLGFVGMLVLGAYAPIMRSGRDGGAHALSTGATGYSALVRLLDAAGREPRVVRDAGGLERAPFAVLTPPLGATPIGPALDPRGDKPTLMVLPKWAAVGDEDRRGWVRGIGLLPTFEPEGVLAPGTKLTVSRSRSGGGLLRVMGRRDVLPIAAPRALQTVRGAGIEPVLVDARGRIVLGKLPGRALWVLADPDLLANHGLRTLPRARAALAMLDAIWGPGADGIAFDVTLNGLGAKPSLLRLLFEPPLLAMTLAVCAALGLCAWQAVPRFGAPAAPQRAIAFGKRALVDNTAALLAKAGREGRLGARYVEAARARALERFRAPPGLAPQAADAWLDRIAGRGRWSELAAEAAGAQGRTQVLSAARRLNEWMGDGNK